MVDYGLYKNLCELTTCSRSCDYSLFESLCNSDFCSSSIFHGRFVEVYPVVLSSEFIVSVLLTFKKRNENQVRRFHPQAKQYVLMLFLDVLSHIIGNCGSPWDSARWIHHRTVFRWRSIWEGKFSDSSCLIYVKVYKGTVRCDGHLTQGGTCRGKVVAIKEPIKQVVIVHSILLIVGVGSWWRRERRCTVITIVSRLTLQQPSRGR